jgi:hypothetical protein
VTSVDDEINSSRIEAIAETAARDAGQLETLLSAVGPARIPQPVREESVAALKLVAARHPSVLLARLDEIVRLLESDNAFTRMAMTHVLATLACADASAPLDVALDRLLDRLADDKVSVAGHALIAASEIARVRPESADRITAQILQLPNVAARPERIGLLRSYAIEALDAYLPPDARTPSVIAFVTAGLTDDSPKTRKLALETLRGWCVADR